MRTDAEIVEQAEALARRFAEDAIGYSFASPAPPIRKLSDPRMKMCWSLACIAVEELQQTDVTSALATVDDDRVADAERMADGATF